MSILRHRLIDRFPPPARVVEPDDQLGHALYRMLRSARTHDLTLDGWTLFKITGESPESIDAVGLMTRLDGGPIPMAIRLFEADAELRWEAQVSLIDESWLSLSGRKQWNAVYLFAGGDQTVPAWSWERTYSGTVSQADA